MGCKIRIHYSYHLRASELRGRQSGAEIDRKSVVVGTHVQVQSASKVFVTHPEVCTFSD